MLAMAASYSKGALHRTLHPHESAPEPQGAGLSQRARGWLKHLWHKATAPHGVGTDDDWSVHGKPAEWWDKRTGAPCSSLPRFDLQESANSVALMAARTPAWREVYLKILDGMIARYTTHWAAVDFLTQFGHDPERKKYPFPWKGSLVFKEKWGDYDCAGWIANGAGPDGVEADPISAQAMLFFKGWLCLILGIRAKIGGKDTWEQPWQMANVDGKSGTWTHSQVAAVLAEKFNSNDGAGLH